MAVLRDQARPLIPDVNENVPSAWIDLMQACWHQQPSERPPFLVPPTLLFACERDIVLRLTWHSMHR
jgi:hypothetical protein